MENAEEYREKYELVKRQIITSLDRLRKLGFFEDYRDLTSEELFENIKRGEFGREWSGPWETADEAKKFFMGAESIVEEGRKVRILTAEETAEKEYRDAIERWVKEEDFDVDEMMMHDTKRVFFESMGRYCPEGAGAELLDKLAWISRGAFNPTEIKEGKIRYAKDCWTVPVRFNFRGRRHFVTFTYSAGIN